MSLALAGSFAFSNFTDKGDGIFLGAFTNQSKANLPRWIWFFSCTIKDIFSAANVLFSLIKKSPCERTWVTDFLAFAQGFCIIQAAILASLPERVTNTGNSGAIKSINQPSTSTHQWCWLGELASWLVCNSPKANKLHSQQQAVQPSHNDVLKFGRHTR